MWVKVLPFLKSNILIAFQTKILKYLGKFLPGLNPDSFVLPAKTLLASKPPSSGPSFAFRTNTYFEGAAANTANSCCDSLPVDEKPVCRNRLIWFCWRKTRWCDDLSRRTLKTTRCCAIDFPPDLTFLEV